MQICLQVSFFINILLLLIMGIWREIMWSNFYNILEVIDNGFIVNPERKNRHWNTQVGETFGGIQGAILKEDNAYLSYNDVGLYHLQLTLPQQQKLNYIGMSSASEGQENQGGIPYRITKHITKLLALPDRGDYIIAMRSAFPGVPDTELHTLFQSQMFNNMFELRNFLSDPSGLPYYNVEPSFYGVYLSHSKNLCEYDAAQKFLGSNLKVRFFKMNSSSLSIKKAEAAAIGLFIKIHGALPELNVIDESQGVSYGFDIWSSK